MTKKMSPKTAAQSLIKAIDRYISKADQNFRDEIESEGFLAADAAMEAEEALENGMTDAINNHVDGVLDTLGDASSLKRYVEKTWPEIQKEPELRDKLHDLFYAQFTQLLHTGVVAYLKASDKEVGIAADEDGRTTPYARDFINGWSGQLADIMHLSTDRQINKILVDSAEKHLSISETTLAIGNSAIRSPGARSRLVAQTEVLRVESYSQLEAMRQDPAASEKEWIHTGRHKNKPRENHVAISGQTVPIGEPFSLSGHKPMCPRDTSLPPEESINCHCIMRAKKDSKVLGLSADERKALRDKYLNDVEEEWANNREHMATEANEEEKTIDWPPKGEKISPQDYKEAMKYAREKGVRMSGFRQFDGDIQTIKEIVDDVSDLAKKFPDILEGRRPATIILADHLKSVDFASTWQHEISVNANAYRDVQRLSDEYDKSVEDHWFVQGTDYRSVIRHELGHYIAHKRGITGEDCIKAVMSVTGVKTADEALIEVSKKLSDYAASFEDGREIISESFSGAFSSGEPNQFALNVLEKLGIIPIEEVDQ